VTQSEFIQLGLNGLSSEDVQDLNSVLEQGKSLSMGENPTASLQIIFDSLKSFDNGSVTLSDLSTIGVEGIGGENQPSLETFNNALNGEDNPTDVQNLINQLQQHEELLIRLEQGLLIVGDLTLLGIGGLSDNSGNIARVNSTLLDSDVSIGRDVSQLESISSAIASVMEKEGDVDAPDVTQSAFIQLGLNGLSSEDVEDLNSVLEQGKSLSMGENPTASLQIIVDSLNAFDNESVTLSDLTTIGVEGIGGENQPSLETFNHALNGEDNPTDIQNLINQLQQHEELLLRLEQGVLIVGDLTLLGIGGLSDNSGNISRVNST
jgi:hypothetical protein